jgi:hypothetical protein
MHILRSTTIDYIRTLIKCHFDVINLLLCQNIVAACSLSNHTIFWHNFHTKFRDIRPSEVVAGEKIKGKHVGARARAHTHTHTHRVMIF